MNEAGINQNTGKRAKKTQVEINQTFRDKHQLIQIPFKKAPISGKNSDLSEYEILIKNAANYSKNLSKFIRDCALEPKLKVIEKQPLINEKLLMEVHKIGVNINQIAHKINAKVDEKEIAEFQKTLDELHQILEKLMNIIRSI